MFLLCNYVKSKKESTRIYVFCTYSPSTWESKPITTPPCTSSFQAYHVLALSSRTFLTENSQMLPKPLPPKKNPTMEKHFKYLFIFFKKKEFYLWRIMCTNSGFLEYTLTRKSWLYSGSKWLIWSLEIVNLFLLL